MNRAFHPSREATAIVLAQLAAALSRRFAVTAICGQPVDEDDAAPPPPDLPAAVRVIRVPHTRFPKGSLIGRLANWISYAFLTLIAGLAQSPDVIIVATDPPILGLVGRALGFVHRCPVITSCQDLYAEVAWRIGVVGAGAAYRLLDAVTSWALRGSDLVVALSDDMARLLQAKRVRPGRIRVIPNWADVRAITPVSRDGTNPIVREWALGDRFTMVYAGNIGLAQDFEAWLEALSDLPDRDRWVALLVGDGVRRAWVEARIAASNLDKNVRLVSRQSEARLPALLSAASLHVVPLKKGLAGCVAPSKVYPIMAAGRPFLAIADAECEMSREALEHHCGLWAPAGDPSAVRERLEWAMTHPADLDEMGNRARRRAVAAYDATTLLERWSETVSSRNTRRPRARAG